VRISSFRVAGLDAQGQRDFEKLPVQRFLADFEAVARELHAQGGGALGEIPVLEVSDGGTGEPAEIHAVMLEKAGVLAGQQGFHQEVRDVLALTSFRLPEAPGMPRFPRPCGRKKVVPTGSLATSSRLKRIASMK
jgi:hypothetical protein